MTSSTVQTVSWWYYAGYLLRRCGRFIHKKVLPWVPPEIQDFFLMVAVALGIGLLFILTRLITGIDPLWFMYVR